MNCIRVRDFFLFRVSEGGGGGAQKREMQFGFHKFLLLLLHKNGLRACVGHVSASKFIFSNGGDENRNGMPIDASFSCTQSVVYVLLGYIFMERSAIDSHVYAAHTFGIRCN